MTFETAFSMDTSSIKFGPGVTREVGHDMRQMGGRRVMVVSDPYLTDSEPVAVTLEALRGAGREWRPRSTPSTSSCPTTARAPCTTWSSARPPSV